MSYDEKRRDDIGTVAMLCVQQESINRSSSGD